MFRFARMTSAGGIGKGRILCYSFCYLPALDPMHLYSWICAFLPVCCWWLDWQLIPAPKKSGGLLLMFNTKVQATFISLSKLCNFFIVFVFLYQEFHLNQQRCYTSRYIHTQNKVLGCRTEGWFSWESTFTLIWLDNSALSSDEDYFGQHTFFWKT